jgi:hypothetical protein
MPNRLRQVAGALLFDWPEFESRLRHDWVGVRNRRNELARDGRGVRVTNIPFGEDLHISNVFRWAGSRLLRRALAEWPIAFADRPARSTSSPRISFVIGHRGESRLPHLLLTLETIAAQRDVDLECIVVEQSDEPVAASRLPSWVRYVHTPLPRPDLPFARSWALNEGARAARGEVVVLQDNDMLTPERYASELLARRAEGFDFFDLKRFIFNIGEQDTARAFSSRALGHPAQAVQNLPSASIAASRDAFFGIGGFDEAFVGWGGEDNEFWERALTTDRVYRFGYLPFIHLWHPPQPGKITGNAPALKLYHEIKAVDPRIRIERLLGRS